jgi:hypothetical protein
MKQLNNEYKNIFKGKITKENLDEAVTLCKSRIELNTDVIFFKYYWWEVYNSTGILLINSNTDQ